MNNDDDRTVVRSHHFHKPELPPNTMNWQQSPQSPQSPHASQQQGQAYEQDNNTLPPGTRMGEFEILGLIGEGGFGIVYLAQDHSLERKVALKEYMPSGMATRTQAMQVAVRSPQYADTFTMGLRSFINEARMLARFDSPSLVKVHRFWEENGTAYMVMPFYEGVTLKQALKEKRVAPGEEWLKAMLGSLCDALDTIHREQCYHRDIAPDNILLLRDGRPVLLDFGAARRVIGDLTQGLTVILKPGFAPIEQYADAPGLRQGPWTDMYALAAVVYFAISGKTPPPSVARIVHDDMPPAREVGKGRYSEQFLAVIDAALAVRPEQRIQNVTELREVLGIGDEIPRTMPELMQDARTLPGSNGSIGSTGNIGRSADVPHRTQAPRSISRSRNDIMGEQRNVPVRPRRSKTGIVLGGMALVLAIGGGFAGYKVFEQTQERNLADNTDAAPAMGSSGATGSSGDSGSSGSSAAGGGTAPAPAPAPAPATPSIPSTPSMPSMAAAPAAANPAPIDQATSNQPGQAASSSVPRPVPQAVPQPVPQPVPLAESRSRPLPGDKPDTGKSKVPPAVSGEQIPAAGSQEDESWRAATAKDTPDAYKAYLKRYPKGKHAGAARVMLEQAQPKVAAAPAETRKEPPLQERPAQGAASDKPQAANDNRDKDNAGRAEQKTAAAGPENKPVPTPYPSRTSEGDAGASRNEPAVPPSPSSSTSSSQMASQPPAQKPASPRDSTAMTEARSAPKPDPAASIPSAPAASAAPAARPGSGTERTLKLPGQTLTGNFSPDPVTGIVSGTGRITYDNGDRFEGNLVKGSKEGKGSIVWANGQRYTGDWAGNAPNGRGTLQFTNGNRYQGEVRNGQPHGQGTIQFASGDVYSGGWLYGKHQGNGKYTWANGTVWEGEYKDGKRTENGRTVFKDGRTVLGAEQAYPSAAAAGGDSSGK
jgi:serine/threonine protein kinase